MSGSRALVPTERIERRILLIRRHKVMVDSDLAELYEVETRALVQAVKRNRDRFPDDFMFQLTKQEFDDLKSQSVTSSSGWGGRRSAPYVFTEQGVAMLSSVLRSKRAVQVNIENHARFRAVAADARFDVGEDQLRVVAELIEVLAATRAEGS